MGKLTFILGVALLIVSVLLWRSCQSKPSSSDDERKKSVDSLVQKAIADSIVKRQVLDSANKKIAILSHAKDSLENILALTKGSLKGKDKDIQALVDEINKAESNNDQSAALAACDSLKAAYPIAKGLVTQYITTNDSLRKTTTNIISQKDTIIGNLNRLFTEANNQVFQFSRLYNLQSDDLKKAKKNANRRVGIGPVIGGGIADNKVVPFFGVGITYSLFKF